MKTTITKLLTLLMMITMAACSDGDPGPAGPQGQPGTAGAPGAEGEKGDPGTANVIYSEWMDLEFNSINDPNYKTMKIEEPLITNEFLENGGISLFFLRVADEDVTIVIPVPYKVGGVDLFSAAQISAGVSSLGLVAYTQDGSDFSEDLFAGVQVRYILIPGGTLTTGGRMSYAYESLQQLYNIPD